MSSSLIFPQFAFRVVSVFKQKNASVRPYQARHGNMPFILSVARLFKTLETLGHLGTCRALEDD